MRPPDERHLVSRIGWLRAAVPGANDGIGRLVGTAV
jgi:VIT1/CCC1 family predicted Fe2+/Mn2+ transporter